MKYLDRYTRLYVSVLLDLSVYLCRLLGLVHHMLYITCLYVGVNLTFLVITLFYDISEWSTLSLGMVLHSFINAKAKLM